MRPAFKYLKFQPRGLKHVKKPIEGSGLQETIQKEPEGKKMTPLRFKK